MRQAHICIGLAALFVSALTTTARADGWHTSGVLYLQGANMDGYTIVNGKRTDVDVSASELFDHLEMAGMMALRSETKRSALTFNVQISGLGADVTGATGALYNLDVKQDMVELAWSWRLSELHEVYLGGRYQSLTLDLSIRQPDGTSSAAQQTKSLADPVVGARGAWPLGQSWRFIGRADIGGFGVDSDLTWSTLAAFDWSVSQNFGLVIGYRALDTKYSQGSGEDRFEFDMRISGPLLGLRYNFSP